MEPELKEEFYNTLQGVLDKLFNHDFVILIRGYNAKVGRDNTGREELRVDTEKVKSSLIENILKTCVHLIPLLLAAPSFHISEYNRVTRISPDNVTEN